MKSAYEELLSKLPAIIVDICPSRFKIEGLYSGTKECSMVSEDGFYDVRKCLQCWMGERKTE